jgi:subtilase family serine protease
VGIQSRVTAAVVYLALLAIPHVAGAQQQPTPDTGVLPDFDIRSVQPMAAPPAAEIASGLERLRAQRPTSVARPDPRTGAARVLFARRGVLSDPTQGTARSIARRFLAEHADALGLNAEDVRGLVPAREYTTARTGLRHVTWTQVVDGIPVFDAVVTVHVGPDGSIHRVTSSAGRTSMRQSAAAIAAEDAVRLAAVHVRPELTLTPARVRGPAGRTRATSFARGPFAQDIEADLTYFPFSGQLRLAWRVALEPEGFPQAYDLLIDAESGQLLYRRNRVVYANGSGRVPQSTATATQEPRRPDPRPLGEEGADDCPPPANYHLRSLSTPFRDPASVLGNAGRLSGNNARVYRGLAPFEGALGWFDGSEWLFDFPFNTADSAETSLFFATNFVHDFFYDLGFDEAAGNFQIDNFGRGGTGGDPVIALARANGRNNATWRTAPEGESPTMSMFLWDGTGCWAQDVDGDGTLDLDGDYDLDIIVHEFHHGVTFRLNTSWSGVEAGAIGEGGGDFFAYSVNGDTTLAEYSRAGGIRRVNGKTYGDWACYFFGLICSVHDNGEIWANVLWDARERFRIDQVGGTEAAGIDESHRIYIDGLKLSPPSPTMLDMRDAMVQADAIRNPDGGRGANFCRLWESFAARGMGVNATDTTQNLYNQVGQDYTVPDGCAPPPPPPVVTIVATQPFAYEAGQVPGALTVTRSPVSSLPLAVGYSLGGLAAHGTDYSVLPGSVTIPGGAAEATIVVVPIDDTLVENDETVVVTLKPGGYVVGTPASATVTIISDDVAPDLQVTALNGPPAGGAGGAISVTDTTANRGSGAAPPTVTSFYLSTNFVVDAADTFIGSRAVPELPPDGSHQATTSLHLPDTVVAGTYQLLAKADGANAVGETNEINNIRSMTIRIGPDLIVSALTVPATAGAGASILVSDTTTNQGAGGAASSATRFYLSTNYSLDAADTPLQARAVGALAPGQASSGSTLVTLPSGLAPGTYYLFALADAGGEVAEAQETNNTRVAAVQVGGDLIVSALTVPARGAAGSPVVISDTTKNQGAGALGGSTTAFYLSANFALDASDVRLSPSRAVPALDAGEVSSGTTTVTLPAGTAAGVWYLLAVADADAAVAETQEGNNTRAASIHIGPDLTVSLFTAPSSVVAGATMNVSEYTNNIGAGAAGASVTRYYLSTNFALDASDILLPGGRAVGPLAAGSSSSGGTTVSVPSSVAPGGYYLIAMADADRAVAESAETNNTSVRFITVTAP